MNIGSLVSKIPFAKIGKALKKVPWGKVLEAGVVISDTVMAWVGMRNKAAAPESPPVDPMKAKYEELANTVNNIIETLNTNAEKEKKQDELLDSLLKREQLLVESIDILNARTKLLFWLVGSVGIFTVLALVLTAMR